RLPHTGENLARRSALEGHPGESSLEERVSDVAGASQNGELASRRHGKEMNARHPGGLAARKVRSHGEDFRRASLARRAVDERFSVGSEPGVEDRLLGGRKRLERAKWPSDLQAGPPSGEIRNPGRRREQGDCCRREKNAIRPRTWNCRNPRRGS